VSDTGGCRISARDGTVSRSRQVAAVMATAGDVVFIGWIA
jgi:hypothetical protein